MYDQQVLVTGSMDNIIAALREMHAAGLLRVGLRDQPSYKAVEIVVGDDSEVRAYYARMVEERKAMEARALETAKAGRTVVANMMWREASELLCRYQERSASVSERPFTLSTNIYGWCVGSTLLMNLSPTGGRFAWTNRGDTLEECIRFGCDISRRKGTTLTFDVEELPMSPYDRATLVGNFGASEAAVAFVLTWEERQAAKQREIEASRARCAEQQAQQAKLREIEIAFEPTRQTVLAAVSEALRGDGAVVNVDRTGCDVRGATFNPSLRLTVAHHGWKIVRTDFDGVRKEHSNVAFSETCDVDAVTAAARVAWAAMKPAQSARKSRRAS